MSKTPYQLLFEEPFGKDGRSVFYNQKEIVDDLCKLPDFKSKNPLTVKSLVSQMVTGERQPSRVLFDALKIVIEKKLSTSNVKARDLYFKKLNQSFVQLSEEKALYKRTRFNDADFKELILLTAESSKILISTIEPAELHKSPEADVLKRELLEKIGVLDGENSKPGTYIFFLPKEKGNMVARDFWERLFEFAIQDSNESVEEINKKMLRVNEVDKKLRVFLVEDKQLLAPLVFFDYDDDNSITGFCVSYKREIPSVAKLSNQYAFWWWHYIFKSKNGLEYVLSDPSNEYKFNKVKVR